MEEYPTEIRQHPKFECFCSVEEYIILMLAKAGYFGGNPSTVLNTPIDWVMKCYHYENFVNKYQNAEMELNKK